MAVPSLPVQWPIMLEEVGPDEDPAIMLAGAARISGTPFRVTAIRVQPLLRSMPDYRPHLDQRVYDRGTLETILADVGAVADTDHPGTIELATGSYVIWMAPAPREF